MTACARCGFDPDAKVSASWKIHVDREPPSLNAHLVNAGPRAFLYRRERDAWCWEFRAARLLQRIPKARARRRVTLVRVFDGRQRERDVDNLSGGMKSVVDALVFEGLLADDSPRLAEIHCQQRRGGPRGLEVLLEELSA